MNAQQPERRHVAPPKLPVTMKSRDDGGQQKPTFFGYAAVFYDGTPATEYVLWPGMVERVLPTAFDRCLREGQDVRGLYNHAPDNLLGRRSSGSMRIGVDRSGFWYEIDFDSADPDHVKVKAKLDRGDLTGSSFTFMPTANGQRFAPSGDGKFEIRELLDVDVLDVGPVSFPAYVGTTAGVRALGDVGELRCRCQEAQAAQAQQRGVVKYSNMPAIRSDAWEEDSARGRVRSWASEGDRINLQKYSRAFGYRDGSASETGCMLLHHDVRDGKLHVHQGAVEHCLRLLDGKDGGGIPEADRAACKSHLERHRSAWAEDDEDEWDEDDRDAGDEEEDERMRRHDADRARLRLAEAE